MRSTPRGIALPLTALALAACEPTTAETADRYVGLTLSGDTVSLPDPDGRPVLLNVWATWCVPCREELPYLQRIHETYAPDGLRVIGVSIDSADRDEVRAFLESFGVTYEVWHDPRETVAYHYPYVGVPATYLIGRDGEVLWRRLGSIHADDPELEAAVRRAIASQGDPA